MQRGRGRGGAGSPPDRPVAGSLGLNQPDDLLDLVGAGLGLGLGLGLGFGL